MNLHKKPKPEYHHKKHLGKLHIYTGTGKGKTSAALGTLLRAAGQGYTVLMIQFIKGHKDTGELLAAQKLKPLVEILQFGRPELASWQEIHAIDAYLAAQGLQYAREAMQQRRPDVLILDEILPAIQHELLNLEDVVDFLDNRHRNTEVILTGSTAHPVLLNMADLVTVMQPTKHYFNHPDFSPRLGIEY
ncbi:MAG: cob(I)yrinic acid a,c-diamide adenosyltransferase [Patescibacteria group bacterium]|jgi:cob(I)alamin adenosyltransferase